MESAGLVPCGFFSSGPQASYFPLEILINKNFPKIFLVFHFIPLNKKHPSRLISAI